MIVITVTLLAVLVFLNYVRPDCSINSTFALIFALICGLAAVIVGGNIGVIFNIPQLQAFKASIGVTAAGAIAAVVLGWLAAHYSLPQCESSWDSAISITGIPMNPPIPSDKRSQFVTVMIFVPDEPDSSFPRSKFKYLPDDGSLFLALPDKSMTLKFSAFKHNPDQQHNPDQPNGTSAPDTGYKFLGTCEVTIQIDTDDNAANQELPAAASNGPNGTTVIRYISKPYAQGQRISLHFREQFLGELEHSNSIFLPGQIQNQCLEGNFIDQTKSSGSVTIKPPLSFRPRRGFVQPTFLEYSFATLIQKAPADVNEATLKTARIDSATNKEVVGTPGANVSTVVAQVTPSGPTEQPELVDALQAAASCVQASEPKDQAISYLSGNDLDRASRFNLYKHWNGISCLAANVIDNTKNQFSSGNQSRALRLLASTIINSSGDPADPTYWQEVDKRRDFTRPFPSYVNANLLKRVIDLLASDDDLVRAEAMRLIKLLPNDQVEIQFQQKLSQIANWNGAPIIRERYAIAANALYYNRIVEWLNVPDDSKSSQRTLAQTLVNKDYKSGEQWMRDDFFVGRSSKPFLAMLLYAKGIVEREMSITGDLGKASFAKMLSTLGATGEPYPSRPQHIAQALILSSDMTSDFQRTLLKGIKDAVELDIGRSLDETSFPGTFQIYIAPDPTLGTTARTRATDGARLLLQSGDWFLVTAKSKIGWIHNTAKS